ncbi:MAG: hypothetical protein LBU30_00490 [Candidatus Methanoplasma sp.]|jgi:hypothetical protein|nr:hypothetical protein [Candidatus Methanoplasma sp.]
MVREIKNPNALINEGPTVIGMMSTVIEGGGSIDTAVRDIADNGPEISAGLFRDIVVKADTRQILGISDGLSEMLLRIPYEATAYRRALHMAAAASASSDPSEKERMLASASEISLSGLKEIGENYSASLNIPCMLIFGLGIMVPMVLMSILPMLSIGGIFGNSPIGTGPITIVTLVLIPAVILSVIISVKEKNPFAVSPHKMDIRYVCQAALMIPLFGAFIMISGDIQISVVAAAAITGAVSLATVMPYVNREKIREKRESILQDSVFELGNRLIAGENYETAVVAAVSSKPECSGISEDVSARLRMCRGDVCSAIGGSVGKVSTRISDVLCDVYRCSMRDTRDAGRLAVSVGRQLQDQDAVRKGIRTKLKSMTDMMVGTASVFAPLVLGMSVTMLGPISEVMDGADLSGISAILSVYLIELCMLISVLTSMLSGKTDVRDVMYRMGLMLPASMIMFTLCSVISL